MLKTLLGLAAIWASAALARAQVAVHVEPPQVEGPRQLQDQTATAVVRDYIQAWESLHAALEQNRSELLDRDFVGGAKEKLAKTIDEQVKAGLQTSYRDRHHDVKIVAYSPEGLSIELTDDVEYDMEVRDKDKVLATQPVHEKYIVVMTPTEVRWRVRVMQAAGE